LDKLGEEDFEAARARLRRKDRMVGGTIRNLQGFLQQVHGLVRPSQPPKTRVDSETSRYEGYLRKVRGLAKSTVDAHAYYARGLLEFIGYERNASALANLTLKRIEGFVAVQAKTNHRRSLQAVVGYLRGFLRFEHAQGTLARPLHAALALPKIYRLEQLPKALPWPQVQALLRSMDRRGPHGLRDYTMLFLMATYGLRCSELVALTLDDIDWRAGVLRVTQRKTQHSLILPLTDQAGDVLQRYLQKGRPPSKQRALFFRCNAPLEPLASTAVNTILLACIQRSGLAIAHQGTHALRQGFALQLLHQGFSMKTIGDALGHRHLTSTSVYLRLAVDDLREVGLPVPKSGVVSALLKSGWEKKVPRIRTRTGAGSPVSARFRSALGPSIERYLAHKKALGYQYTMERWTLLHGDAFLHRHQRGSGQTVDSQTFGCWARALARLAPRVQRSRLRIVRSFLLYHARDHAVTFIPDLATFPKASPTRTPRLVSPAEMANLLATATQLPPSPYNPLRSQTIRVALILLFCCGLRRGELQRLTLKHMDGRQNQLHVENTKFHKSRWVPLPDSVAQKVRNYLELRRQEQFCAEPDSYLIPRRRSSASTSARSAGEGLTQIWQHLCITVGVVDERGRPPRLHDLRHSMATSALQRWYEQGADVQAKLPHLATYLGHVNAESTHYYLQVTPALREAASQRFHRRFTQIFCQGGGQ
jgi:site-specific recombinase XerD